MSHICRALLSAFSCMLCYGGYLRAFACALPLHSGLCPSVTTSEKPSLNTPPPLTPHRRSWSPSLAFFFLRSTYLHCVFYIYLFICCCCSRGRKPRESASSTVTSLKLNMGLRTWKGLSKCMLSECVNAFTFMKTLRRRYCYLRYVGEGAQSQMT